MDSKFYQFVNFHFNQEQITSLLRWVFSSSPGMIVLWSKTRYSGKKTLATYLKAFNPNIIIRVSEITGNDIRKIVNEEKIIHTTCEFIESPWIQVFPLKEQCDFELIKEMLIELHKRPTIVKQTIHYFKDIFLQDCKQVI